MISGLMPFRRASRVSFLEYEDLYLLSIGFVRW
jgi:hypothetical protein